MLSLLLLRPVLDDILKGEHESHLSRCLPSLTWQLGDLQILFDLGLLPWFGQLGH